MECPNCHYHNRADAHFCQGCGADLALFVPACASGQAGADARPHEEVQYCQSDTVPLPNLSSDFQPLPEGSLLGNARYVVREVRQTQGEEHIYLVEDLIPTRRCPNCAADVPAPQTRFCAVCGADLSNVSAVHLHYLVRESAQAETFATEAHWLSEDLHHPGVYLPGAIFEETPYGDIPRYYRVTPEFSLPLASDLSIPCELNKVLEWGHMLADALAYLHQHQLVIGKVGLERIAVNGKVAQWLNLNQCHPLNSDDPGQARQDVYALTQTLLHWTSGDSISCETAAFPKSVARLFDYARDLTAPMTAKDFATELERNLQSLKRPDSVTLEIGWCTDVGQLRSLNEDSLLVLNLTPVFRSQNHPLGLFLVADGMGGHDAGDIASELTVRVIAQRAASEFFSPAALDYQAQPDPEAWLTDVVRTANKQVYEQRKNTNSDMGTTLVLALCTGKVCTIANVGDSRCYHLTSGGITQLTTDHSLVERLVATGQILPQDAVNHPQKNVIYRVMGDKPKVEVDLRSQSLEGNEALLLCSDGLSSSVSDDLVWRIWRDSHSPQQACDRLVETANQSGGEDNISVIIVQIST